jgi:hypothetical protein
VNHVLSVGEIYDKAIDLCLRDAGKIALSLGAFCLATLALGVLSMSFRDDKLWTAMNVRPREPVLHGEWISVLENMVWFVLIPVIRAALTVLFDRTLHGRTVGLRECFHSTLRRTVNVIVASFLLDVASVAAGIVIWAPAVFAFVGVTRLTILGPIVGLSCVLTWLTAPLMIGVAAGFAQVALDAGRVIPSMRLGIANAFAKTSRGRA